jgi:hypothetical protein
MRAQNLNLEPEEKAVARECLYKHVSMATNSNDHGSRYASNDKGVVGGGVLCWVRTEAI